MDSNVERDMKTSSKLFCMRVWPVIQPEMEDGELIMIEDINSNLAKELDCNCGFDAIVKTDNGMISVASRVQANKNKINYKTFTIRKSRLGNHNTEYKKRKMGIDTGIYLTPYYTCQAYFDGEKLLGVGLVRTKDIILSINDDTEEVIWDNVIFYVVPYESIELVYEYDCLNLKGEDRIILKSDYDRESLNKRFKEIDLDHFTDDLG